jgi:hypothetical protein
MESVSIGVHPWLNSFAPNVHPQMGTEKNRSSAETGIGVRGHVCALGRRDKSLPVGNFDLASAPSVNEFNGRRTVQLKVLDWRSGTRD